MVYKQTVLSVLIGYNMYCLCCDKNVSSFDPFQAYHSHFNIVSNKVIIIY